MARVVSMLGVSLKAHCIRILYDGCARNYLVVEQDSIIKLYRAGTKQHYTLNINFLSRDTLTRQSRASMNCCRLQSMLA